MKKIFAFLLVAVLAASLMGVACAEGFYSGKTVEVIVPWGAGGGADTACRLVCQYVEKELGCTCVINNVTGGGGSIGLNQMLGAEGYDKEREQIIRFILHYKNRILKDSRAPRRDKIAIRLLSANYGLYKAFWTTYQTLLFKKE